MSLQNKKKVLELKLSETRRDSIPLYNLTFICPKTNEFTKYGIKFKFATLDQFHLYDCKSVAIKTFLKHINKNFSQDYEIKLKEV